MRKPFDDALSEQPLQAPRGSRLRQVPIGANMVFACHPTYVIARTYSWACDNSIVDEMGMTARLHRFPQTIIELG